MEKISSSEGSGKWVCKKCSKEFDSFNSWRAHLGFHGRVERQRAKKAELDVPPPAPLMPAPQPQGAMQALAGLQPPPAPAPQGGFDMGQAFMAWVMRQLMEGGGGGKLEREIMGEALETYRELLKLPRALISSITGGLGGGLKEVMKGVVKEVLREELKSIEDLVRRYAAGGGEKEAGSQAPSV